jgi:multisubunit Na+/H+ antiporter MnhB subunit
MDKEIQVRQSDIVTTTTSVTLISLTIALIVFFKTKNPDLFISTLMLLAICLLALSAFKSYVDISIASYKDVKEVLNIKLFAYFGGLVLVGISIIRMIIV